MSTLPFAASAPQSSVWGWNASTPEINYTPVQTFHKKEQPKQNENICPDGNPKYDQYMPAVLLNSLKRDKKPFTYTPGRVDLSEVLNAKLQKRMERRKKSAGGSKTPEIIHESPTFEPPKQVLVMPTYNSPLNMYSMENALEALEVQAELTVADKSDAYSPPIGQSMTLPRNYKYEQKDFEPKNVTQSKAFRVLQIITDTDENPDSEEDQAQDHGCEYKQFSGMCENKVIPSRYFHNLQRITRTEDCDTSNDMNTMYRDGSKASGHIQQEMQFTGIRDSGDIPSRLFHNLQKVTGTLNGESQNAQMQRSQENAKKSASNVVSMTGRNEVPRHIANFRQDNTVNEHSPVLRRPAAFLPAKLQGATKVMSCYSVGNPRHFQHVPLNPYSGTDL